MAPAGVKKMVVKEPQTHRFTRREYYAMGELGLFANERVELIEGEIIVMSPQLPPHGGRIRKLQAYFSKRIPDGFSMGVQLPLDLGLRSEPEPDISISLGEADAFLEHHPKSAELVIQIANASVNYDRTRKGSLYAKGKIPEFWLINLPKKCLEVFREPVKAKGHFFGFKYAQCQIFRSGATIAPLRFPEMVVEVKELLP